MPVYVGLCDLRWSRSSADLAWPIPDREFDSDCIHYQLISYAKTIHKGRKYRSKIPLKLLHREAVCSI
jgi:hypothetical protein